MGLFDTIGSAVIGQGGNYLNSGHQYTLEVVRCFSKTTRKGAVLFIAELLVHESNDPKILPGSTASWAPNFQHEATVGNVLWFLGACYGIPVTDMERLKREITTQVAEYAVSPSNPLAGRMVEVDVQHTKTRAGGDFSKHAWTPTQKAPNEAVRAAARSRLAAAATAPTTPVAPPAPPGAPPAPFGAPPGATPFPPPGWQAHPSYPGYFHNGVEALSEAQLRQKFSAPVAPAPVAPAPVAPTPVAAPAPSFPTAPALPGPSSIFGTPPPIGGPVAPPLQQGLPPGLPPPMAVAKPFPPQGWQAYPGYPGFFHNGVETLSEAALRAR
jgi:hypothetical protein